MANSTSSAIQFNEEEIVRLLADLSDAKAPSGFEDAAIDIVRDFVEPFATVEVNSLRCAFVTPKNFSGEKPVVMLDAHGDEVGMMVMSVRDNGCLSFVTLGGINDAVLTGEKVYVHTVDGSWIPGVIGLKPPHFMSAAEKASGAHGELLIDVGATSRADAIENFGVAVGEPVVFATQTEYDAKHRIAFGKAFDCRVGVVAMLLALRELAEMDLDVDVVAALSSQEEVGDRGIASSVRRFEPAVCYMFEGAPADDTFTQSCDIQCALHKGPMFRHYDCCMITNPRYQRFVLDVAKREGIPAQQAVRTGGGTNAGTAHMMGNGIPCVVSGVPTRYIHAGCAIAAIDDVENSARLAVEVMKSLTPMDIAQF